MSVDIYTTPGAGTHNFPSAGTAVVEIWGGGQGGENGSAIPNESGDGGAGGSYSKRTFSVTSTGYSYYVGDGGAASAPPSGGDVGEDSWFESDTLQLAKGGGAGSGNIGDVTYTGGAGGARAAVKAGGIGGGGGSSAGSAANGNNGSNGASGGAGGIAPTDGGNGGAGGSSGGSGSAGVQPGGGGGGGGNGATSGGAGAAGKIVVTFTADPEPPDEPPGPPPPPEPPDEPPPPEPPVEEPPRKLIIRDKTGRLPKNPKHWPAGLKAAVAGCCGCDESSSSSSSSSTGGGGHSVLCCPTNQLPSVLYATITGNTMIDGTYTLNHTLCPLPHPLEFPIPCPAWVTDLRVQFTCRSQLGPTLTEYSFALGFTEACGFIWVQYVRTFLVFSGVGQWTDYSLSGMMKSFLPPITPLSCNPFHFYYALGTQANGGVFPPLRNCILTSFEPVNGGAPTWTGPKVEITV